MGGRREVQQVSIMGYEEDSCRRRGMRWGIDHLGPDYRMGR